MNDSLKFTVLIGVGFYMAAMLGVGFWSSRKVKNFSDFLVAGRNLPFFLALATLFATWFGGGTCMGASGAAYTDGAYAVIADPYAAGVALILAGLFYVGLFRRLGLLTVTDIFGRYYSKGTEIAASLLMIPVYIGWLGSQMVAFGYILNIFTGMPPGPAIILGAAIVLIYTYAGGMWAVTLTDFIQVIFLIAGLLVMLPLTLEHVGGLSAFLQATPASAWNLLPPVNTYNEWTSYLGQWALMGLGVVVGQDLIQRSLASKNESVARSSAVWAGIGYLTLGSIPVILGMAARMILPEVDDPETVLPMLALKFLHPAMIVLFVGALVSAILSSADSSLLAATSLLTNNVIRRFAPRTGEKKLLQLARSSSVVLTVLSMFLALHVKQIYELMVNSWATLFVAILVPVTAALYWKRANRDAAWVSMIAGTAVWLYYLWHASAGFTANSDTVFYQGALYGGIASLAGYLVTTCIRWKRIQPVTPAAAMGPSNV